MFATLTGPFPAAHDDAGTAARLADIGLEPVSDGRGARGPGDDAVAAWRDAAAATTAAVKQALLGPFSTSRRDGGDPLAHAEAIGATAASLRAAGCPLVEIEEPEAAMAAGDPAAAGQLSAALRRLTDQVTGIHLSLVLTGGNVDRLGAATFFDLPFASYAFDLIAGPDNWRLIAEAPRERGIVCGALDPSPSTRDGPETLVWAAHYAASTRGRGLARVGLANASSIAGLTPDRAERKVKALVEAARLAALKDPEELAASLDPKAVDSRSAALGKFTPKRRR
ncbi:MAG TPA: hypothetical protein VFV72_05500 [Candidatus Limnocylindrales bacterium]|nr:hypothetical protein [Candidatus Limnocylindrales bacterium]